MGRPESPVDTAADAPTPAADAQPHAAVPGRAPRRYWRYPAAAVALLAVAAANFVLGRQSAYDAGRSVPSPAASAGPAAGTGRQLRFGFEDSVAGWAAAWNAANLRADLDAGLADTGQRSLRLEVTPDAGAPPAIGTDAVAGLHPGGMVTVRIYLAGSGSGQIRPYVQDSGGGIDWSATPALPLTRRGWTTYDWQVPDVTVRRIGFEVHNAGAADLVIALDTVVW